MAIKIRSLGYAASRRQGDVGCCGGRSSRNLGDPVMTLDGGLGITSDYMFDLMQPRQPAPRPPDENLFTTFTMMQAQPIDSEPPPLLAPEPAPAPAIDPTTNSTGTFAPENPPPAPAPTSSPAPAPSQEAPPVQGGENTVKIAVAVGGTLVLAALILKGR